MIRGIGGVFLYVHDPVALAAWYSQRLGIEFSYEASEGSFYHDFVLPNDSTYGRSEREVFAIRKAEPGRESHRGRLVMNWRVHDLAHLLDRLHAAGVQVDHTESYDYGRFAWLKDPVGHELELFEPAVL